MRWLPVLGCMPATCGRVHNHHAVILVDLVHCTWPDSHATGYSRVKLAIHRETGQQYAVKIIPLPKRERDGQGKGGCRIVTEHLQQAAAQGSEWHSQPNVAQPRLLHYCAAGQSVNKYLSNRGAIMKVGARFWAIGSAE